MSGVVGALQPKTLLIWFACSVVAAFSGPFGTYRSNTVYELFLTWSILLGMSTIAVYIVHEICTAFFAKLSEFAQKITFVLICAPIIATLINFILISILGGDEAEIPGFWMLTLYVFLSVAFMLFIHFVFFLQEDEKTQEIVAPIVDLTPASLPAHSRLAKRLNIPQSSRIIHITAKGHFVEVQTCSETYQTRMRFLDAVDELDGTYGVTVHRSHWVHRDAIRGWVPDAKKPYVLLENDSQIPVSKTNMSKVEKFGIPTLDIA